MITPNNNKKLESRSVDIIEKDIFVSYLSHGSERTGSVVSSGHTWRLERELRGESGHKK